MAGEKRGQLGLVGELPQAVQGGQVVGEVAVVPYDSGAATQHGVTGEQGVVGGQVQADGVGRVARGGDDVDLAARGGDRVPGGQALVAEPVRGVGGADWGAGQGGERGGTGGVVGVRVGEQDLGDPLPGGGDLVANAVQVARVAGARIDDHRPG